MSADSAPLMVPAGARRLLQAGVALGAVAFVGGVIVAPHRAWGSLLGASYFIVELALAGLFFLAVHDVAGASWHQGIRRVPEAMALALPIGAFGILLVLVAHPSLYPSVVTPPSTVHTLAFKRVWLSRPFFLARAVAYLACWTFFARSLVGTSQARRVGGAADRHQIALSARFLVTLALTLVPASFDWIMSLEPEWYSAIFGFYDFAGMFLSGLAAMVVLILWMRRLASDRVAVSGDQLHDLGTLLFAFSIFWAYIWFCQYMLIWYGNLPEETAYFVARQRETWDVLFVLNLGLNWAVPFVVLLGRAAKRRPAHLLLAAGAILAGRFVDLYLAIAPGITAAPTAGLPEIGLTIGAVALFTLAFLHAFQRAPLAT